jgi:formate dehydrogenase iron-sulfur subunit
MKIDRREFLRISGAAAGFLLLPCSDPLASAAQPKGMLVDLTKCIGCGWCQQACKEAHGLPTGQVECDEEANPPCLSAQTWTLPEYTEVERDGKLHRVFAKRQCMHCLHPACVSACPVGALQKTPEGPVIYDPSRCIGCRYCMVACPFGIPKFEWEKPLPRIQKCTFCAERQEMGLEPACAAVCPAGALTFGDREALIAEAEARIQADPAQYLDHVYGKDEVGGTSWIYLSPVPFEDLAFPDLGPEPVTELSETMATAGTASVAASAAAVLGGLYYWFNRRGQTEQTTGAPPDDERETQA